MDAVSCRGTHASSVFMNFSPSKNLLAAATGFCLLLLADAIRWAHPTSEALHGSGLNLAVFLHALVTTFLVLELRKSRPERAGS